MLAKGQKFIRRRAGTVSAKRKRFLQNARGDDVELCREVENLINSFANAESSMKKPAAKEVANFITSSAVKHKSRKTVLLRRAK